MMPDFFALPRPPQHVEQVSVEGDGRRLELSLRAMDLLDLHRIVTLRDRMVERYVPFSSRRSVPPEGAPDPVDFPPVGGEPIELSEETCEVCATLVVMQASPTLSFEQLVAMAATCPALFEALAARASGLNRAESGKVVGASTTDLSALPLPGG